MLPGAPLGLFLVHEDVFNGQRCEPLPDGISPSPSAASATHGFDLHGRAGGIQHHFSGEMELTLKQPSQGNTTQFLFPNSANFWFKWVGASKLQSPFLDVFVFCWRVRAKLAFLLSLFLDSGDQNPILGTADNGHFHTHTHTPNYSYDDLIFDLFQIMAREQGRCYKIKNVRCV